jgi:zinc/manganese transport system substrate-binding protein
MSYFARPALCLAFLCGFAVPVFAEPLPVVASFSILGDMVRQVGGDAVRVTTLVGADGDAHSYQTTSTDLKTVSKAQLTFVNGLGFDPWAEKLVKASDGKARLVVASAGITPHTMTEDDDHAHDHGHTDPHAWQDLRNGKTYVANITTALVAALPDQAEAIRQRAATYTAQIEAEDAAVRAAIAAVPEAQRLIITSHDAFGYFGAAYGVRFAAPYGLSTESEPSARAIGKLVSQIKKEGVTTVFIENMSNPKLIEQLGKDGGATIGKTLYADALSPPDGPAPNYLAMFRYNVPLLVAAMQQNKVVAPQ